MPSPIVNPPGSRLQPGIYLERGVPPPSAWRSIFLNVNRGTAPEAARAAIASIAAMLAHLQAGATRDLGPASVPSNTFDVLVGYGRSFFDPALHHPSLTTHERPDRLVYLRRDDRAFPSIPWAVQPSEHEQAACSGEADLMLQFTGTSNHAVSRAAVEVSHLIRDERLPLDIAGTFDGFLRDDGRSWIGFHDGVSNIEPSERLAAVESTGDPAWTRGGTYLAFLRLQIAIDDWRALARGDQELIVGRDKLTGWPIGSVSVERDRLTPEPVSATPLTESADWKTRDAYFNAPDTGDAILEASHTHRTNQNKGSGTTSAAHRIFRQGYEYLDDLGHGGPRLGLNFISFQNDLLHIQQILGLKGWLGDANFGGGALSDHGGPASISLATLRAGGYYVLPPREKAFPGASLFAHEAPEVTGHARSTE